MSELEEMTDVVFALSGDGLPMNHAYALWRRVVEALPWLEAMVNAGILPLCTPEQGERMFLPRRAKLVLRVPASVSGRVQELSGQVLDLDGYALAVGAGKERVLQAHPTLHAQLVASALVEEEFLAGMAAELRKMGVSCKLICGKRLTLPGSEGAIRGYSLVAHDLKPQESLRLQWAGLGGERHFGCGMLIPYKMIANLDA